MIVKGVSKLVGKEIVIPDLRAGFSYVMAAMLAKDKSVISGLPFLDRGYENLDQKLLSLGADIQRKQLTQSKTSSIKEEFVVTV